ncbi:reverse transcriptase domain-containing protein [Lysinibacillus capsici]|uniref:reverse transcriptase domain-containing protein n=1 Tax=Lysinibacillus TaxID=400634 RepID=UPI002163CFAD|nr:reverse transcriptase domain-containing protein [Lysinibacillus boronitolerans]MCS1393284.1 reverse transcriptase domain-containing protein [Lysinibacillus boronitolerans]
MEEKIFFEKIVIKENIKNVFEEYVAQKTDNLTEEKKVKVPEGLDNIDYILFQKNLPHQIDMIYKRIRRGNYFFYPLREIEISKDPQLNIEEAKKLGKTRVLSIATIRDVLTQKMLYDFLSPITEREFTKLPYVSFAYRKNVNAQKAAQKVYNDLNEGYIYALDADLKGFFDNIPHDKLYDQIKIFFNDMPKIQKLLYRFIHVDKGYKRKNKNKVIRVKRNEGIPQGGIISGMLANIYLHQFDCWVMSTLKSKHNIRYTRYADDFVILAKSEKDIIKVKDECEKYLNSIKLTLHPDPEKTKISKVNCKRGINFVGFTISNRHISIKQSNVLKFKKRIENILNTTDFSKKRSLELLKLRMSYKYFGNDYKKNKCKNCGEFEKSRNWVRFFLIITDYNQLNTLDNWVYKSINYYYFQATGKRLPKNSLKKFDFPSLEKLYYEYRKQLKKETTSCKCTSMNQDLYATEDPYKELFNIYP